MFGNNYPISGICNHGKMITEDTQGLIEALIASFLGNTCNYLVKIKFKKVCRLKEYIIDSVLVLILMYYIYPVLAQTYNSYQVSLTSLVIGTVGIKYINVILKTFQERLVEVLKIIFRGK